MVNYDLAIIGHLGFDDIKYQDGTHYFGMGGAVFGCSMAAGRIADTEKIAVITRTNRADFVAKLETDAGVKCYPIPTIQTHHLKVIYTSTKHRDLFLVVRAGFYSIYYMSAGFEAKHIHLTGSTNQEFNVDFIRDLKQRGYQLSLDMQNFVRQVEIGEVQYRDVPEKEEIASLVDSVKLDDEEALLLTGQSNLEKTADLFQKCGCPEVLITYTDGPKQGVYARFGSEANWMDFVPGPGRNWRGDTFSAAFYLWKLSHPFKESLEAASLVVSEHMKTPGPFRGNREAISLKP